MKLLLVLFLVLPAFARAQDQEARALLDRMLEAQRTRGFTLRAKLTVTEAASRRAAQLRVKCRREPAATRLVYEVLWPAADKGKVLCLERSAAGALSGFRFDPPEKVEPITNAALESAFLDSDLNIEDLVEDFWRWPDAKLGAEEQVERELCRIVNLRPPTGAHSSYSLIRAWIAAEKAVPMRVVKFSKSGAVKEFAVQKIMQTDGFWVPVVTVIQTQGGNRETLFEISRGDRDAEVPAQEFTPEHIRRSAAGE